MSSTVSLVSRAELIQRRARLLRRVGLDWSELRRRAESFALTDEQRSLYDTIRGIDWMLRGQH